MANTVLCCCFHLQTNDPVINVENDEKLMLKPHLSLLENGVGEFWTFCQLFKQWVHCDGDQTAKRIFLTLGKLMVKGELNHNIKLDLNDSCCTLINKYNPHVV